MVANTPVPGKKYYSVAEANAALPLVRAIVRDIADLAKDLHERQERLQRIESRNQQRNGDVYEEEIEQVRTEIERGHERMKELLIELKQLGIELKDYFAGLIDFPCWMGNREVYLCWRMGEAEVGHWHELDAGFAGRQKIKGLDTRMVTPEVGA